MGRHELYAVYDLPSTLDRLNPLLDAFQHLDNHHRPQGALGGITPAQYLARQMRSRRLKRADPGHQLDATHGYMFYTSGRR